ncbi:putative immunity protein [Kitasatospora sp. NPDC097643]|uniref:putative immunity protein n=1 Tax=Kitasatospora sp. NPDC097643 TaxID=3157230 RepID=UPI0033195346
MGDVMISDEDRRLLGLWAADCAERALALYEAQAPHDTRPREALEGVRAFARDGKRTRHLRTVAWAALKAASEAEDPAAAAAARAAGYAAAAPYIHPLATPHQVKHVLEPAVHAAHARELAAGVGEEELARAIAHAPAQVRDLVRRLPACTPGHNRVAALRTRLDAALRG